MTDDTLASIVNADAVTATLDRIEDDAETGEREDVAARTEVRRIELVHGLAAGLNELADFEHAHSLNPLALLDDLNEAARRARDKCWEDPALRTLRNLTEAAADEPDTTELDNDQMDRFNAARAVEPVVVPLDIAAAVRRAVRTGVVGQTYAEEMADTPPDERAAVAAVWSAQYKAYASAFRTAVQARAAQIGLRVGVSVDTTVDPRMTETGGLTADPEAGPFPASSLVYRLWHHASEQVPLSLFAEPCSVDPESDPEDEKDSEGDEFVSQR